MSSNRITDNLDGADDAARIAAWRLGHFTFPPPDGFTLSTQQAMEVMGEDDRDAVYELAREHQGTLAEKRGGRWRWSRLVCESIGRR